MAYVKLKQVSIEQVVEWAYEEQSYVKHSVEKSIWQLIL
jgi:hypothetical protein